MFLFGQMSLISCASETYRNLFQIERVTRHRFNISNVILLYFIQNIIYKMKTSDEMLSLRGESRKTIEVN